STPPAPGTPAPATPAATPPTRITVPCAASSAPLVRIPELVAGADGVLRGALYTVSEQVRMPDPDQQKCSPQVVRADRLEPGPSNPSNNVISDPLPGPTLRARVGDLVTLTFMNQIDPLRFPDADGPCDTSSSTTPNLSYPGNTPYSDRTPDCLTGSVYTNLHYHGTHTSPQTTADNVFLMIAPSPRAENAARTPAVTRQNITQPFAEFFARCEAELPRGSAPKEWPRLWRDLPQSFRDMQQQLLKDNYPKLYAANLEAIEQGNFPQYYTGAFPYCFRLPVYTQAKWPPVSATEARSAHTHGAGEAEVDETRQPQRPLIMGQAPGTHWYHAHKHGSTTINVLNGMTGAFIIEGKYDDDLNKVYGDGWTRRQPVLVLNQLAATAPLLTGGKGGGIRFSVNGRTQPVITMRPGEVQLWRIVNSAARSGINFNAPGNDLQWRILAKDGVQFTQHNYDESLNAPVLLMSGNRVDLLVKAPATTGTINIQAYATVDPTSSRTATTLMTVNVAGTAVTDQNLLTAVPEFPPFLENIKDDEITGWQKVVFATTDPPAPLKRTPSTPSAHTIDGRKFDGELGLVVGLNQVQEWTVVNETYIGIAHPFHIHINPFQIVEIFAPNDPAYVFTKPPESPDPAKCYVDPADKSTWKPCAAAKSGFVKPEDRVWWDVFPIPSGKTVGTVNIPGYFKMRSRFVDYPGYFVTHCHILAHEDRGMMTVVQVAPLQTPYSHH
ncbi:MAG TPA: multicopper oxidase domain-containing protein, partial [Thermoanaerobaculia bacterium]